MSTPEIQKLLDYADESHGAARVLIDGGFVGFHRSTGFFAHGLLLG
jgi:hypothetical protein